MEKKSHKLTCSLVKILRLSKKYYFVFTFLTHTICTVDYKDLFFNGILLSDINFHFCPRWKIFDFEHKGLKNCCFLIKLMELNFFVLKCLYISIRALTTVCSMLSSLALSEEESD